MRSVQMVPVAVVGLLCLTLSFYHASAAADQNAGAQRELNVFRHGNNRNNRNGGNYRNRNGGSTVNGGNYRNAPARPLGPEKLRAMRRHFKFPTLKRALNDANRIKGVGPEWKDMVMSDTSSAGTEQQKETSASEIQQQQEQHAPEYASVMDVVSSFVPTTIENESSSNDNKAHRRGVAGITMSVLGLVGIAIFVVRRRLFGKDRTSTSTLASSNTPIRMVDANGDAIDLGTDYGFGGSESLGSRSSVSRGYLGYHL